MQTRTLDTDPYRPDGQGADAARGVRRCLAMEKELSLSLIAGGRDSARSLIGRNSDGISLFSLTWRRQLEAKRVPRVTGGLAVQRWPSAPVIAANPNLRVFLRQMRLELLLGVSRTTLERMATKIDPQTRVGTKVRKVESWVKKLRGCPQISVIKISHILMQYFSESK